MIHCPLDLKLRVPGVQLRQGSAHVGSARRLPLACCLLELLSSERTWVSSRARWPFHHKAILVSECRKTQLVVTLTLPESRRSHVGLWRCLLGCCDLATRSSDCMPWLLSFCPLPIISALAPGAVAGGRAGLQLACFTSCSLVL